MRGGLLRNSFNAEHLATLAKASRVVSAAAWLRAVRQVALFAGQQPCEFLLCDLAAGVGQGLQVDPTPEQAASRARTPLSIPPG